MLALARPSVNEVWPLAANQNHRFNRPANDNNITSGLCTRTKYTYDAADRLVRINYTASATQKTEFGYDGLGRRLTMTETAAGGSPVTATRYLWCQNHICQQRGGTDTVQTRYYKEGEYRLTGAKKYLYQPDQLDSTRDVVDITGTATLVGSFDFKPYGPIQRSSGTVTPGYLYAGLYYHPVSSLYLSATRFYDPATVKWLHRDPIREAGDPNTYGYGRANPTMLVDPDGRASAVAEGPITRPATGVIAGGSVAIACADGPISCAAAATLVLGGMCVAAIIDKSQDKVCPPCSPPAGEKFNKTTHWVSHSTVPGTGSHGCEASTGSPVHWHYSVNNQNPKTCQCFTLPHEFGGCGPAP